MIGKTVSHYKIVEKLGEGGMGVVYKAQHLKLDSFVALKFLPPHTINPDARRRLVQEARATSSLQHPNICAVHDIEEMPDGTMFIVMPYYEGETLEHKLATGPLSADQALDIVIQIASALEKAHGQGIIHRDLKPANVFITTDGHVKVLDFGLAKYIGLTRVTRTGMTVGTVSYMSPEQARGDDVDARSDVFSLGVVLYEMLSGERPFRADHDAAVLYAITNLEPRPMARLDPMAADELQQLVTRALQKNPAERYSSMTELLADLRRARGRTHAGGANRVRRPAARRFALTTLALGLVLAGFAAFKHFSPPKSETLTSTATSEAPFVVLVTPFWGENAEAQEEGRVMQALIQQKTNEILGNERDMQVISGAPSSVPRSHSEARQLGEAQHATIVVWGDVLLLRDQVMIQPNVTAVIPSTGSGYRTAAPLQSALDQPDQMGMRKATAGETANLAIILAARCYRDKDPDKALSLLRKIKPPTAQSLFQQAMSYRAQGPRGYDKAEVLFKRSIAMDPTNMLPRLHLGWMYYLQRRYDECIAVETAALAIDSSFVDSRRHLGLAYAAQGRDAEAIREYRKAIELGPELPDSRIGLGNIFVQHGQYDQAAVEYKGAIDVAPGDASAHWGLAVTYAAAGKKENAVREYKRTVELDPGSANAHVELGRAYRAIDDYEAAERELRKAIEVDSTSAWAHGSLGLHYFICNQLQRSIDESRKAIEIDSTRSSAYLTMARAYCQEGKYRKAIATCERATQALPRDAYNQVCYFTILERAGESEHARKQIAKFAHTASKNTWPDDLVRFYAGEINEAALLKTARSDNPRLDREQKCEAYHYLGMADLLGINTAPTAADTARAIEHFKKSVGTGVTTFVEYWYSRGELALLNKQ